MARVEVRVALPDELYRMLLAYARLRGLPPSAIVEEALVRLLGGKGSRAGQGAQQRRLVVGWRVSQLQQR